MHALGAAALCCTTLASCSGAVFAKDGHIDPGAALFTGSAPITARTAGDEDDLPSLATRCINCHERTANGVSGLNVSPNGGKDGAARTYASALDEAWLTTPRVRHGGPATQYDEASFCTVIRTGVDPASVLIPPIMPRYDATDAQCANLWTYLRSR